MKVTEISYSKVFNLGDYQNEKIGCVIALEGNEMPEDAILKARRIVEYSRNHRLELEKAKALVAKLEGETDDLPF